MCNARKPYATSSASDRAFEDWSGDPIGCDAFAALAAGQVPDDVVPNTCNID